MDWKDTIKKKKFQGPQTELGGITIVPSQLKHLNQILEFLERDVEASPDRIKGHVEDLRKIIDKIDSDLIQQAKYGDSNDKRVDSKYLVNAGAKYEEDVSKYDSPMDKVTSTTSTGQDKEAAKRTKDNEKELLARILERNKKARQLR